MTSTISSLADLLAPVTPEAFFADHHGRRPLHVPGAAGKLSDVMDWASLTALLNQNSLWTSRTLELVLDTRKLEPGEYCLPGRDREGREAMMADLDRVGRWLRQGASMVMNDIDALTPALKAVAGALEDALGGKAQGNLYCSWRAHQAFGSHFDTHDVYALHFEGEKTWRIYGRHFEDPIAHPAFKSLGQPFHDAHKGPVTMEVTLRPGDLLYIPRGWYHDALASSEATFHVAFGVTSVIGLDFLGMLYERAVQDALFRNAVPRSAGAMEAHLAALGDRLAALAREEAMHGQFSRFAQAFRYPRGSLDLPADALERRWKVRPGIAVLPSPDGPRLGDPRRNVRIPPGMERTVAWVVGRRDFGESDFAAAFPSMTPEARARLFADLGAMKVIEPA